MRLQRFSKFEAGLTLVELLVIMAFVVLLVLMLFPVTSGPTKAPIARARAEEAMIHDAIQRFQATCGHLPVSPEMKTLAEASDGNLTFGGPELASVLKTNVFSNAEVMAILMDLTTYPDGRPTVNRGHRLNTNQIKFLSARLVQDTKSGGIGPDYIYRDPWGHPYIISMDLNEDGKTRDAFYWNSAVSRAGGNSRHYGLSNSVDSTGSSNTFELNDSVMVWSLGPDGKADISKPANEGPNKDNILDWKK